MQYELKNVQIAPNQHPGFTSLHLLAEVKVTMPGTPVSWRTIRIPILAEPDRWKARFTCRIYRWSTASADTTPAYVLERDYGITGLGSVPGLKEQARATARQYWDSIFLPNFGMTNAPVIEGTIIPEIVSSTALKLKFDELKLGNFLYSGEIMVHELENGELQGKAQRFGLHVLLGMLPSGNHEHHSLNESASKQLIAYLLPRAKQSWTALKLERTAKKVAELQRAIADCKSTIANAQHELNAATAQLPGLEAELKKVTEE